MNLWKPIALVSMATTVLAVAYPVAHASPAPTPGPLAGERQPNMEAALAHLQEARASLEKAEHNKGGWRVKAIEATDVAIGETKRGMAFADLH
jgi:hypothetical protein